MDILLICGIIGLVALALLVLLLAVGYVKAPPDKAYIISGLRKKNKILIGKAGFRIPFLERLDKVDLSLIPIDVKTASEVPTADYINIKVDANVNVKVGTTHEALSLAAVNFLNLKPSQISQIVREVLEGNLREIIGEMRLEEMVSNRLKFAEAVKANAEPDLAAMGLEIISFNVQNFIDANGVIENLGIDNVVRIQKNAAISRAQSERDIAIEKAKATMEANDAKAAAQEQIAERNAQLETKQAELKRSVDTQKAQANAAMEIEAENQRKLRDVASTNADIAKAERKAELKQKEIQLKEYELTAVVRKKADADKYAVEQAAEAQRITMQNKADADRYKAEREIEAETYATMKKAEAEAIAAIKQAEAMRAEADAKKYSALAEAEGIAAIGAAEAEAIQKKAEAQKLMGEASVLEMYLSVLPEIVKNAAAPLANVDKMTIYGDNGTTKVVGDVMTTTDQIMSGLSEATGFDIKSVLAGYLGAKVNQ